jgi:hypothetical protein
VPPQTPLGWQKDSFVGFGLLNTKSTDVAKSYFKDR